MPDGLMGYRTPNIDRIAAEGMRFTDSYGEQSCTAGRSSFITGQSVFRTGSTLATTTTGGPMCPARTGATRRAWQLDPEEARPPGRPRRLGRRAEPGRPLDGQHLAGRVPGREHRGDPGTSHLGFRCIVRP
jgi:hypothetical protein